MRLRWELRGERTLDHARLADDLVQGLATVALTWGPSGDPGTRPVRAQKDADQDGVRDKADRCPETLAGAIVDPRGCALDSDRDGVANGIDQCEQTKPPRGPVPPRTPDPDETIDKTTRPTRMYC